MQIAVLGAGAWGTALAMSAAGRQQVTLWARDPAQAAYMAAHRVNTRYLPDCPWPDRLSVVSGALEPLPAWLCDADVVIVATPMAGLRSTLTQLANLSVPVAWLCKGFE